MATKSAVYRHFTANEIPWKEEAFRWEIAMQAYLIDNPAILSLSGSEDEEVEVLETELKIEGVRNKDQGNGRVDLLVGFGDSSYGIVEIKKGSFSLGPGGYDQLADYVKGRQKIVEAHGDMFYGDTAPHLKVDVGNFDWKAVAVCTQIDPKLIMKLWAGELRVDGVELIVIELNRFRSKLHDDQVFVISQVYRELQRTKPASNRRQAPNFEFEFEGRSYRAPSLALSIVKRWHALYPQATAKELLEAFPPLLQIRSKMPRPGTKYGVVVPYSEGYEIFLQSPTGKRRHFLNSDNILILADGDKYVVSSEWWSRADRDNISQLINHVKNIPGFGAITKVPTPDHE